MKRNPTTFRVFVSFEYERDLANARNLIAQAQYRYGRSVVDMSLSEPYRADTGEWVNKARAAISNSDVIIVLLGPNTHNAPGVTREIKLAKSLGKPVIQVRPQAKAWRVHQLLTEENLIVWKWKNLDPYFESNFGKR